MKKVIFGVNIEYKQEDGKWKKKPIFYPKWSEIIKAQPIKKGQTTVMRTGEEFGIMCLDVDTKDPQHPDLELMMEIYDLAPTVVQETQNGFHFFYEWDKRLAKSASKITKNKNSKLDIKSTLGLISIQAPIEGYYIWWNHTGNKLQKFNNKMWLKLKDNLTNKYQGIPLEKKDEILKLDELIEKYEDNPTEQLEKKIQSQQKKIDNYDRIINYDDYRVENARDYPIRTLLNEPTANIIKCISPDHNDKTPSMQITGNFAYCHGCGEHFSAIDIYMIKNSCDFKTALNNLTK
jgi:hypothetical protein